MILAPSDAPKKRQNPVLIGGLLILLVVPLALPQSSTSLYWQVLGIALLSMGVFYTFVFKSAVSAVVLAATFAAMFEAPLKYLTDSKVEAAVGYLGRDLLIYSLVLSLVLGLLAKISQGASLKQAPPATLLIICFVLNILIQIYNPYAYTSVASFLNSRLFWEMLPLYFIGYYYLRSVKDWKILFTTFALLTVVNGVVATYQSSVGPEAIAAWGPGYRTQIYDAGRVGLTSDNQLTFRPFGLGPDIGFSGYMGLVTIPMLAALLSARSKRQDEQKILSTLAQLANTLFISLLIAGTFAAVIVSGSRTVVIFATVLTGASLLFFSWKASKIRLFIGLGVSVFLALAALELVSIVAPYYAERYTSVNSAEKTVETFNSEGRIAQITEIPLSIALRYPFGAGLDNLGPGAAFSNIIAGSPTRIQPENAENNINFALLGLGIPGLLLWLLIHLQFIRLTWKSIQSVGDQEAKTLMGGGLILLFLLLANWPFGALILFPYNMLFWLIPGMIFGTADAYRQQRLAQRSKEDF
jgi:hypothetical protein